MNVAIAGLLVLPMAGFLLTAVLGRRQGGQAFWVPVIVIVATWAIGMLVVWSVLTGAAPFGAEHHFAFTVYTWIPAGAFQVPLTLAVDNLTAALLIVVCTVGMLVHVYSIGYMHGDPGMWRFFAYLNLFMFSMLLLVLASNFLVMFVAWELVGLCSYLLIGFWYRRHSAALAAKKAFVTNRVGDVGFALGIAALWTVFGTLDFDAVFKAFPGDLPGWQVTGIALLLFTGAVGKSAQFPLHVWLPDAMEGPTPVSALIHAATMVNAGVYMVARTSPIFAHAAGSLSIVAGIGIFTAILAASIALTQTDIKRVLAYSTLSQLGYMFAALGVGAFTAAIFHLVTHGFFKGLLFLGSGSVIHAVHDEQDMRKMGGLARKIPWTYATMLIGSLAIAGLPPLAGFFSKDEILAAAFKAGGDASGFYLVWAVGFVVAGMTAFYMFRLMGLTFWGESRVDPEVQKHIHEAPWTMLFPLVVLALASIVVGFALGYPPEDGPIHHWLAPIFEGPLAVLGRHEAPYAFFGVDGALAVASVVVALVGIAYAWRFFGVNLGPFQRAPQREQVTRIVRSSPELTFLYRASVNKWWFDDINNLLFVVVGGRIAGALQWFDVHVVDGAVNGIAALTRLTGGRIARLQTGRVQNYAFGIALGLVLMAVGFLVTGPR